MNFVSTLPAKWRGLTFFEKITVINHVVVIIAGLASIIFFGLERSDASQQAKRETALQFIALSYTEDIQKAKRDTNAFIIANQSRFAEAGQLRAAGTPSDFTLPTDAADAFIQRLEFYDNLLICRDLERCDKKLIDGIFRKDICDYYGWVKVILPQLERNYGPGIAERSRRYCPAGAAKG